MGSANNAVSAIAAYMAQGTAATNVSNVVSSKKSSQTAATSFDNVFNKVSDSLIQARTTEASKDVNQALNAAKQTKTNDLTTKAETTKADIQVDENTNTNQVDTSSQEVNENTTEVAATSQTNETQGTEADTKLQEAITEDGKELMAQIAETFDVNEEDIVNAMQVLGLMAADLLDPANIQMLVTELTGQEEAIDHITDSDIYTSLQDLMEGAESMKSELMNEFNLSEEELRSAVEDSKNSFKEQFQTEKNQIQQQQPEIFLNPRESVIKEQLNTQKTTAPQSEAFTEKVPEEKSIEIITEDSKGSSDNKGNFHSGAESSNLFNQVMNNIADAVMNADPTSSVSYTDRAQMEDIIRQITEKITISSKAEETSMELQLHPASLGNVNVLLTSGKDGIVAKFTAQNQIVREAVEAQMVQLTQKFEENGIKVTSIEVTVGGHGFEQNLEQGNDRQPGQAGTDKKVKPLRRINLSELEDDQIEELTSDADRIAASMMAVNGNSVDFSA
ncbi:flagellar hook-length control protein FliK [Butyrivibrio sp. AE2032]|uniref:flagellar hook-length control protein FliK n=1 Tax=Butyrivibrio sp. AE2032 TaxID=1458463 RepID=UPI0005546CE2|nr:flagellar hook-length control protein FliK [Butyrivibrio sp. AE2032]